MPGRCATSLAAIPQLHSPALDALRPPPLPSPAQPLQAALFVGQADLVLVGADAVTEAAAVNKAGTHLLALAAHARGVPVYVAADTSKLSPGPLFAIAHPGGQQEEQQEEPAADEVTAAWGRPVPAG